MKTKNAMQLKARINIRAKEMGIPPQMLMQNYLFERLLERISASKWRHEIVLKGGMLIASLLGIATRTTMDLDTTIRGFPLSTDSAVKVFQEIAAIQADDDWQFQLLRAESIREEDEYQGVRVHLQACYAPMSVPLTIDVTTGDAITPAVIEYEYPLLFDDHSIKLMAYPLETVLSEKLETVITRGVNNTRPRDYYDIYALWHARRKECNLCTLKEALLATCTKRHSCPAMKQWKRVVSAVAQDEYMNSLWQKYTNKNLYAAGIAFDKTCECVVEIMTAID